MAATDPPVCAHGGLLAFCPYCTKSFPSFTWPPASVPVGWRCGCGKVFSPAVTECPYCPQQTPAGTGGGFAPFTPVDVPSPAAGDHDE
jgi:hypothetical protein